MIDGVPYYAHTESHNLNDLIDQLQRVLDDHSVPTVAFFLVLGPLPGFSAA